MDFDKNIVGNDLNETYPKANSQPIFHIDELLKDRRKRKCYDLFLNTGDGAIYYVVNKVPYLALTRQSDNPVLKNITEAFKQFKQHGNYSVNKDDFQSAIKSKSTLVVNLNKLNLTIEDKINAFLPILTKDYANLNSEERMLAERVYGKSNDFIEIMQMLAEEGIEKTKVYILSPKYVMDEAKSDNIARACWVSNRDGSSVFIATDNRSGVLSKIRLK